MKISSTIIMLTIISSINSFGHQEHQCKSEMDIHRTTVEAYIDKRKSWRTSILGTIIYKNVDPNVFKRTEKQYKVLMWMFSDEMKHRYTHAANDMDRDVLDSCSVQNCLFYDHPFALDFADAVVMHINRGPLPDLKNRSLNQRWILLSEEAPDHFNAKSLRSTYGIKSVKNFFNWTMNYRSDADIPIPYGRTVPLKEPVDIYLGHTESALMKLVPHWDDKQFIILASTIVDCDLSKRNKEILHKLQQLIKIDITDLCAYNVFNNYLKVTKVNCPKTGCEAWFDYIFYLSIEASSCRQFITEKCFYQAYEKGSIPVIVGPPLEDCEKLLPPKSFLHIDSYKSIGDLAAHMVQIAADIKLILEYHSWRKHFEVVNEHGYFKSRAAHYCRVCEGLNYNDRGYSAYNVDDLMLFFDEKIMCKKDYNTRPKL